MRRIFLLVLFHTLAKMNAFQFSLRRLTRQTPAIYTRNYATRTHNLQQQSHLNSFSTRVKGQMQSNCYRYQWSRTFSSNVEQDAEVSKIADIDIDIDGDGDDKLDYTSTRHQAKDDDEDFFDEADRDADRINYPKGTPEGFYVTKQYSIPEEGFENLVTNTDGAEGVGITQEEVNRLGIDSQNITLPIALMLLDDEAYPSLSRARKACRKGYIVVNRGPLVVNEETGEAEFGSDAMIRGRVIDRVYPGGEFLFTFLINMSVHRVYVV